MSQTIKFEVELEADMVSTELTNDIVNEALEDSQICATAGILYLWGEGLDIEYGDYRAQTTWKSLADDMLNNLMNPELEHVGRGAIQSLLDMADRLRKEIAEFDAENE